MPATTLLDIPQEEQDQMLAALRRARYGYLLALHVLLLGAAGRNPTDIAAFLFCSRSSVYRIVLLSRSAARLYSRRRGPAHGPCPDDDPDALDEALYRRSAQGSTTSSVANFAQGAMKGQLPLSVGDYASRE